MQRLSRSHIHTHFDRSLSPVADVDPGGSVLFETLDACFGEVRKLEDFEPHQRGPNGRTGNPLTGPVRVRGARPGDTLIVEVLDVRLDAEGFQLIGPNRAVVRDEVPERDLYPVRIEGATIRLPRGLRLPVAPVVGTLGVAPAGPPSNAPGPWGGNLDVPQITPGAAVHLPIQVEGALFSLGDVHARQGDGEVVGAPEIGAEVKVRFRLLEGQRSDWPLIEDAEHWWAVTCGPDEAEALRRGVFACARLVEQMQGVRFDDALILMTMMIRLHCSRTGEWGGLEPVVCSGFPKKLIEEATAGYRHD